MRGFMESQGLSLSGDIKDKGLLEIYYAVERGERLGKEELVYMFNSGDIFGLRFIAESVSRRLHDSRVFFVCNRHINPTNVCTNRCRFCAYYRSPSSPDAYVLSLSEVEEIVKRTCPLGVKEYHVVGGLNPNLDPDYFFSLVSVIKKNCPQATIKAYTAVEIEFISRMSGADVRDVLVELKERGNEVLPGGGAEVFSERIRKILFPNKIPGERWLEIHGIAHELGYRSNATMLYGHIETVEERAEHLLKLRELQDKTGGFFCFIPLKYHYKKGKTYPEPTSPSTGLDDLKMVAASRIFLDNFPHIKAYWVMLGEGIAQMSLLFGATDMDGTVMDEKITHEAGGKTPLFLSKERIRYLIKEVGKIPVERDGMYREVKGC